MRLSIRLTSGLAAGLAALAFAAPAAAQTGSIKGSLVLKGDAPKLPAPVLGGKDPAACTIPPIHNEMLIVDPASKGIKNVFVWIAKVDASKVSKEALAPKTPKLEFDNKNCMFVPHCVVAHSGQTLVMLNDDSVGHNVHTHPVTGGGAINQLIVPKDREGVEAPVGKAQIVPIPVKCDIHPWMTAYMLILDHNFAALTDEKGAFAIEGLPPGKYDLKIWHEAGGYSGYPAGLAVKGLEVKADGAADAGEIQIDVAKLKNLN